MIRLLILAAAGWAALGLMSPQPAHAQDGWQRCAGQDEVCRFEGQAEFDTVRFRFRYQSMITPASVYDYDLTTHERTLLKRTEVLGGYDPSLYATDRRRRAFLSAARPPPPPLDYDRHCLKRTTSRPSMRVTKIREVMNRSAGGEGEGSVRTWHGAEGARQVQCDRMARTSRKWKWG